MKKILFIVTDAGGGHRKVAQSIQEILKKNGLTAEIVNIYHDILGDHKSEKVYNCMQKLGLYCLYWPILVPLFKLKIKWLSSAWKNKIHTYIQQQSPTLVVSFIPFLNHLLSDAIANQANTDFWVVMTDMANPDNKKNYWLGGTASVMICPTQFAYQQAIKYANANQVMLSSGIPLSPSFSPSDHDIADREKILIAYGINPPNYLYQLCQSINDQHTAIVLCGKNKSLQQKLADMKDVDAIPYCSNVADYMQKAKLFIGKPGPTSISEAIQLGIPVLIQVNQLMKQEKTVVDWVLKHNLGLTFSKPGQLRYKINQLLSDQSIIDAVNGFANKNNAANEISDSIINFLQHNT